MPLHGSVLTVSSVESEKNNIHDTRQNPPRVEGIDLGDLMAQGSERRRHGSA